MNNDNDHPGKFFIIYPEGFRYKIPREDEYKKRRQVGSYHPQNQQGFPIRWKLLAGRLEDGRPWLVEMSGHPLEKHGFDDFLYDRDIKLRLETDNGMTVEKVILHKVDVDYLDGLCCDDIELNPSRSLITSSRLYLASPNYRSYVPDIPFERDPDYFEWWLRYSR